MFSWLGGSKVAKQRCLGPCGKALLPTQLVLINHCYHEEVEFRHRSCAGVRLLCGPCHLKIGTYAYYEAFIVGLSEKDPEQYPWDHCLRGLALFYPRLAGLVAKGIDPANRDAVGINW